MRFKDLQVGQVFFFVSERHFSSMAKGPWIKQSARLYREYTENLADRQFVNQIGSINAEVEIAR